MIEVKFLTMSNFLLCKEIKGKKYVYHKTTNYFQ